MEPALAIEAVLEARARLAQHAAPGVVSSPLVRAPWLDEHAAGQPVWLKDETTGPTGAFKIRGATNAVANLSQAQRARGVVTASTGNHGRALAFAATSFGVHAVICLSSQVPANKVEAARAAGGDVRIVGHTQDEANVEVQRLVREAGMTEIPPFDHPDVIAGQGTIGLELAEKLPDIASVLVGLSGGGLAGGIGLALKAQVPKAQVIGLSPAHGGAAMYESLRAGRPVDVPEPPSLADSLGGGIDPDNRYTFTLCQEVVDSIHLVEEAQIAAGMRLLYREQGIVAEGSGAIGPAALLAGLVDVPPGPVVCIISGAGVAPERFEAVLNGAEGP